METPTVRLATPEDEGPIYALLLQFHSEYPLSRQIPLVRSKVEAHIRMGTRRDGAVIGVADALEGGVIGTIGLFPQEWWWSDRWFFQQCWVYVLPAHRAEGRVGDALFQWAAERRAEFEDVRGDVGRQR